MPTSTIAPPTSIQRACQLMLVGAVLSVVFQVLRVLLRNDLRAEAIRRLGGDEDARHAVQTSMNHSVGGYLLGCLIAVALWLFLAQANSQGRRWARVIGTILAAVAVLSALASSGLHRVVPVVLVADLLVAAVGVAAAVLLWLPASNRFYAETSARFAAQAERR